MFVVLLAVSVSVAARQDSVLAYIDGEAVLLSDFRRVYRQPEQGRKAGRNVLQQQLERFIDFRLKLKEAKAMRLDTSRVLRKEYDRYRDALFGEYLASELPGGDSARRADREAVERVHVRQIFKRLPQQISAAGLKDATVRMDSIYDALARGASFGECADRYSDEKASFWVSRFQMPVEFEDTIAALRPGGYSRPFFTPLGIHIVQVLDRVSEPASQTPSGRTSAGNRHFRKEEIAGIVERLKVKYRFTVADADVESIVSRGDTVAVLFTLGQQAYTGKDFRRFTYSCPYGTRLAFRLFTAKSVLDYAFQRFEDEDTGWSVRLKQRYDSLLVAQATSLHRGDALLSDSLLEAWFESHRSDYDWPEPRFDGIVLHAATKRRAKQMRKLLKSLPEGEWEGAVRLMAQRGDSLSHVICRKAVFAPGADPYVDQLVFKGEKAAPHPHYPYTAILGKKKAGPSSFREVYGSVSEDCRQMLEQQWEAALRKKSKVEINQEVLKTVNSY